MIKVGGSLFDLPDLGERLQKLAEQIASGPLIFFPGGGAGADVIRDLDRRHRLGAEHAHWLALRALTMNAEFLQVLLPGWPLALWPDVPARAILEPYAFASADESAPGHLPHTWEVTSDSLAVRAAYVLGATDVLLLKSTAPEAQGTWEDASRLGLVDAFFPVALRQAPGLKVHLVNLRGAT